MKPLNRTSQIKYLLIYSSAILLLLLTLNFTFDNEDAMTRNLTIHQGSHVRVFVPEKQLGINSIKIESNTKSRFTDWSKQEDSETYDCVQRILNFWKETGVANDYLIYAKEVTDSQDKFAYEIVPYKQTKWPKIFKQLRVLWNMAFGSRAVSQKEGERILNAFKQKNELFTGTFTPYKEDKDAKNSKDDKTKKVSKCAFCTKAVIERQQVYNKDSDPTLVLYNHAPIGLGKENHHFMVIPKAHHQRFEEVTKEEFESTSINTRMLLSHYQKKGCNTTYFYSKVGIAGQTVPHWHQHVVPLQSKMKERLGKINVFFRNIFGTKKLPDNVLISRVENYRKELEIYKTTSEPANIPAQ